MAGQGDDIPEQETDGMDAAGSGNGSAGKGGRQPDGPEAGALQSELARLRAQLSAARAEAETVKRDNNRLRHALELVPVGVLIADAPDGRIIHGNTTLEELTGHPVHYSANAASYDEWEAYHSDGTRVRADEYPLSRIARGEQRHSELDVHYQRPDGERRWIRIIGQAIEGSGGELRGAAVAVIDIDRERRHREEQRLMVAELDHRVRNIFATMLALVSRSLSGSEELESAAERLQDRIHAYAESHAALTRADWTGGAIGDVASVTLGRHIGEKRVIAEGPHLPIPAKVALCLSMTFHELATNAMKYGALSVEEGYVKLEWWDREDSDGGYVVRWSEHDGPPVEMSDRQGFGSFITRRAIALEADGTVTVEPHPEGLVWTLTA